MSGPAEPGLETALHMDIIDCKHFIFLFWWKMFFLTSGVIMTQMHNSAYISEIVGGKTKKQAVKKLFLQAFRRGS